MRMKSVSILALVCIALASHLSANPIQLENRKAGSSAWLPRDPALLHEIEGYASRTSINRGEQISLFVNTPDSSYTLQVFRMGWYGGLGGRVMTLPITLRGVRQVIPTADPVTGLIECNWRSPYILSIPYKAADPTEWASGVYLVKLIAGTSKKQSYINFTVRDDARPSDYLFQSTVTTYQAYNAWGGKSLYKGSPVAFKVSFNRPYDILQGNGSGKFLNNGGWEFNMLRWLEREGYDVTYSTNIDTHASPALLVPHKAILSVGHDEYWSHEMRTNVTNARDAGLSLVFFSANSIYWQVRFEPATIGGEADRTMVCYKQIDLDPIRQDGNPTNDFLTTIKFRELGQPEDALMGVMYTYNPVDSDIIIEKSDHPIFYGTGLKPGDKLPGLLGYEVDRMFGNAPPTTERLARSPFTTTDGLLDHSDMTIYTAASGAVVFAAGTIQWSWGLDDYNVGPGGRTSRLNPAAQKITRNVLLLAAGRSVVPVRSRPSRPRR
ncbi:MAG TPA: N,N-dimethylformamidase beta subunit family domain-containing protein [Thermoanaerobaculia bacterium]|nr:N,N-dimethylformamidase beta subunit family domain-containing protein [Thermoanaerobaculia bacterium]